MLRCRRVGAVEKVELELQGQMLIDLGKSVQTQICMIEVRTP